MRAFVAILCGVLVGGVIFVAFVVVAVFGPHFHRFGRELAAAPQVQTQEEQQAVAEPSPPPVEKPTPLPVNQSRVAPLPPFPPAPNPICRGCD